MKITSLLLLACTFTGTASLLQADEPKPSPALEETPKPKPYPLTTCLVTGKKLDSMGEPYVFTHEGQEIKMCCKPCLKKFEKEPAKYLEKLKTK